MVPARKQILMNVLNKFINRWMLLQASMTKRSCKRDLEDSPVELQSSKSEDLQKSKSVNSRIEFKMPFVPLVLLLMRES